MDFSKLETSELDQFRDEDPEWTLLHEESFLYSEPFVRSKYTFLSEEKPKEGEQTSESSKIIKDTTPKVMFFFFCLSARI
jgi:hypothetical protein